MKHMFFREPTGSWRDQLHVQKIGFIVLLGIIFVVPDIAQFTEWASKRDSRDQWVVPRIAFVTDSDGVQVRERGEAIVNYGTTGTHTVRAHFILQTRLFGEDGPTLCTGTSEKRYTYSAQNQKMKPWLWSALAEQMCPEPVVPYALCLRYVGEGEYGTPFDTPWHCFQAPLTTED